MGQALKKDIVYPNSRAREVERWDSYMGVDFAVRKMKVQRALPPQSEFTEEDDDRILKLVAKIDEIKSRPPIASKKKQEQMYEILAQIL